MKTNRPRRRRSPKPPVTEEALYCSIRACQDVQRLATCTIVLWDAVTKERLIRHRCDEHTDPRHTVIARVKP